VRPRMGINYISRDWGVNVSIVRISTSNTLDTVSMTDYILDQAVNIVGANNGPFTWQQGDEVLVQAYDGNGFFQISNDFNSLIPTPSIYPNYQGLTALAGGGQDGATQLNFGVNVFTVVATTDDSAILPNDTLGQTVIVVNTTANEMDVYPYNGDTINYNSVDVPVAIAAQKTGFFYGVTDTNWQFFSN
jgi:hypothetical protein